MGKTLKRSVYLEGVLLKEGDEVTDEQAKQLSNPKLFDEPADATGPDANDAREYQQLVRDEGNDKALRAAGTGRDNDPGKSQDTDDRAAAGAKLARGGRASAPAANN